MRHKGGQRQVHDGRIVCTATTCQTEVTFPLVFAINELCLSEGITVRKKIPLNSFLKL